MPSCRPFENSTFRAFWPGEQVADWPTMVTPSSYGLFGAANGTFTVDPPIRKMFVGSEFTWCEHRYAPGSASPAS